VKVNNYKVPHHAIFFSLQLLLLKGPNILLSTLFSRGTKFYTHTKTGFYITLTIEVGDRKVIP
jgi:hypothetical protein